MNLFSLRKQPAIVVKQHYSMVEFITEHDWQSAKSLLFISSHSAVESSWLGKLKRRQCACVVRNFTGSTLAISTVSSLVQHFDLVLLSTNSTITTTIGPWIRLPKTNIKIHVLNYEPHLMHKDQKRRWHVRILNEGARAHF